MPAGARSGSRSSRPGSQGSDSRGTGSSVTTTALRRCSTLVPVGAFDGLERHGRNLNQGAESTLAMLATAQQARRISELA